MGAQPASLREAPHRAADARVSADAAGPPLRILLVSDSYPPLIGGATRASHLLAQDLARRGHAVCVATSDQEGAPARERDQTGVHIRRLPGLVTRMHVLSANPYRRIPPPFPDPETALRFRHLITHFRPDVIHSYGWMGYSCALSLGGRRIPFVVSGRDYANICPIRTLVRHGEVCSGPAPMKCLECARTEYGVAKAALAVPGVLGGRRLVAPHTYAVHSVSRYVQAMMRRHLPARGAGGLPPEELVAPDYREDDRGVAPDEAILAQLPSDPFILFVGALRRIKGLVQLLEAYEQLRDAPPLVLIGTRADDTPAEFPRNVQVLFDVPHPTVMAAWPRALFGVAPSTLPEPLGNVVHEAMSQGRPVIGTRPGGHEDMIDDGVNGLLVPAGDSAALAAAMRRLIDDGEGRERMAEAA